MKRWFGPVLGIVLGFVAPLTWAQAPVEENPLLASVNNEKIHLFDLREYAKARPFMTGYMTSPEGARRVLDDMINFRLLELEGARRGLEKGKDEGTTEYVMRVKAKFVPVCELPGEEGAKAFYQQHPELFSSPVFLRLSRAMVPLAAKFGEQSAQDYLTQSVAQLKDGTLRFDTLVETLKPLSAKGAMMGDVGFQPMAEADPLIDLLKDRKPGEFVGPYVAGDQVFVFAVTDRREALLTPWEEARRMAGNAALSHCNQEAFAGFKREAVKHFPVVYEEENLSKLRAR